MPVFAYKAMDGGAAEVSGTVAADTPHQARDVLRGRGLSVRQIQAQQARSGPSWLARWGVSDARLNSFYRELSTLLAVGIPLLEAMDTVSKQHEGRFKTALLVLKDRVAAGVSLADAMAQQPHLFDPMARSIVEVGERAGTLEQSLQRLAEFREKASQLKGRIGTALLYPLIVLVMGLGVGLFLMTYVVPNLLTVLQDSGRELPLATKVVKSLSDFLVGYWWALLVGVIAGGAVAVRVARYTSVRRAWHRLQLRVPLYGELVLKQSIARIAMVIATLGRSDVPFVRSVQLAQRATRNMVLREALIKCENAVYAGRDIADALQEGQGDAARSVMPPMVVQVFAVGQASGRLEEMLERLAADYDQQVSVSAQRLTAVLEPLIILLLAVVVGFIAFATIMPILEVGDVL